MNMKRILGNTFDSIYVAERNATKDGNRAVPDIYIFCYIIQIEFLSEQIENLS